MKTGIFAGLLTLVVVGALMVGFLWPAQADGSPARNFDAGVVQDFEPGSLRYLAAQHVYLIRLVDGDFVALYDWDAWAQRRYVVGDKAKESCRVAVVPSNSPVYAGDLQTIANAYAPVAGLEGVVLRSGCDGSSFDALGRRGFGPAGADLDRLSVQVDTRAHVIVNLVGRQCEQASPCLDYL